MLRPRGDRVKPPQLKGGTASEDPPISLCFIWGRLEMILLVFSRVRGIFGRVWVVLEGSGFVLGVLRRLWKVVGGSWTLFWRVFAESEAVLRRSSLVLSGVRGIFGRVWVVLGGFGVVLGGVLGGSWSVLTRALRGLGGTMAPGAATRRLVRTKSGSSA